MEKINKFDEKQIFQLYAYLAAYEYGGFFKYKSTKSLLKEHPELKRIQEINKLVDYEKSTNCEMKVADFLNFNNKILITKSRGNLLLSFLAHLRNSIAHGHAIEYNSNVLITDFANPRYSPTDFTARGSVTLTVINEITNILKLIKL